MKICKKCGEKKELEKFIKDKGYKDGYRNQCKECKSLYNKKYSEDNKDRLIEYGRQYRNDNREELRIKETKRNRAKGVMTRKEADKLHSLRIRGANHPNWKGGISTLYDTVRKSIKYKEWRTSCFERDGYKCQISGEPIKGDGVVHHIYPFNKIIKNVSNDSWRECNELWELNNGITIKKNIHNLFHKIYGKQTFDKFNLIEFINNYHLGKYNDK